MADLIVAMSKAEDAKKIADLLKSRGINAACVVTSGAEALQMMNNKDYGVLLCGAKFPDMGYAEISEYMPKYFKMVLMTRDPELDYSMSYIELLHIPFRVGDLCETVERTMGEQDGLYRKKRSKPAKRSEEEQAIIDRAKKLLMKEQGMSEPESHRYIQKCSMDTGTGMVEAAEMVLLLFEAS